MALRHLTHESGRGRTLPMTSPTLKKTVSSPSSKTSYQSPPA